MPTPSDTLIASLVDDLAPARPMRFGRGLAWAIAGIVLGTVLVLALGTIRSDLAAGRPDAMFLVSSGLFLLLALAATATVVRMAAPRVGASHDGWRWAAATAGLLPGVAGLMMITDPGHAWPESAPVHGLMCMGAALAIGTATVAMLVAWLRQGAPTDPQRAGLLTGIAGGAAGVFAGSLRCPLDSLVHIGLWHGAAVVLGALAGWLVVPRLVRW
jgi:hypothetical protein